MGIETGWGNGYVVIPPGHPAHGVDYDNINVEVHYGLTFGQTVTEDMFELFPSLDKDDIGGWLVGFDTAHYGDTIHKWPTEAVLEETERLVYQLQNYTKQLE